MVLELFQLSLIIANSCWQAMTAFEEKVGNNPDPCKVPILNLKTRAIKILDFSDDDNVEDEVDESEDGNLDNEEVNNSVDEKGETKDVVDSVDVDLKIKNRNDDVEGEK